MTGSSGGTDGRGSGESPEPTIADVMNAFSLDSGRKPRRRRWGRHRPEETGYQEPSARPGGADGGFAEDLYSGDRISGDRYSGDRSFGSPSFDHNDFKGPDPVRSSRGGFGRQPHHDEWDE